MIEDEHISEMNIVSYVFKLKLSSAIYKKLNSTWGQISLILRFRTTHQRTFFHYFAVAKQIINA